MPHPEDGSSLQTSSQAKKQARAEFRTSLGAPAMDKLCLSNPVLRPFSVDFGG